MFTSSSLLQASQRTSSGSKKKNFSAFIVEKGTPGFSFGTKEKKMGIRGSSTYELNLRGLHVFQRMHYLDKREKDSQSLCIH